MSNGTPVGAVPLWTGQSSAWPWSRRSIDSCRARRACSCSSLIVITAFGGWCTGATLCARPRARRACAAQFGLTGLRERGQRDAGGISAARALTRRARRGRQGVRAAASCVRDYVDVLVTARTVSPSGPPVDDAGFFGQRSPLDVSVGAKGHLWSSTRPWLQGVNATPELVKGCGVVGGFGRPAVSVEVQRRFWAEVSATLEFEADAAVEIEATGLFF